MKRTADKYTIARNNLLLVLILTVVNIVMMFADSETMFLFSATIPYITASFGYMLQWYACYVVTVVILLLYLACWYFSKKHHAWMIVATVLFVLDSLAMLWLYDFTFDSSIIFDMLIHIWVLYYLIMGVVTGSKIKKQAEGSFEETVKEQLQAADAVEVKTSPLRIAEDTKCRVFLEVDAVGRHIVFRRVKNANELVINGYVYDEYVAVIENPHRLVAGVDDHIIEAGINAKSMIYIKVDGEVIEEKLRIV